jgi:hypothetical protein
MDMDVQMDHRMSINEPNESEDGYMMNRRSSLFGVSGVAAGLATVVAGAISLPTGPATAASDPAKVVAVPVHPVPGHLRLQRRVHRDRQAAQGFRR